MKTILFSTAVIIRQAYSEGFSLVDESGYIRPFGDHYDSDLCLATVKHANKDADIVSLEVCQNVANFKWQHETSGLVRQTGTNRCWRVNDLDVDDAQNIYMSICDETDQHEMFTLQQNDARLVPTYKTPKGDQVCIRAQARAAQDLKYGGCQETNFGQLNLAQMSLINNEGQIKLFNGRYGNLANAPPPKCLAAKWFNVAGKSVALETCKTSDRFLWSYSMTTKQIKQLGSDLCFQVAGLSFDITDRESRAQGVSTEVCDSSSVLQQFDVSKYGRLTPSQSQASDITCLRARAKSYADRSRLAFGGCHEVSWGKLVLPDPGACDSSPCKNGGECERGRNS